MGKANQLEQIFWKDGKYLDKEGNYLDKRKLKLRGIGEFIRFDVGLGEGVSEEYCGRRVSVLLSRLKGINKEYKNVNAYIINWNSDITKGKDSMYCPILFFEK